MSGKTSRTKGHNFERFARLWMREHGFPDCETSRYADRSRDDVGVDLVHTGIYSVQCKCTKAAPNMHALLGTMPQDGNINLVWHKRPQVGTTVTMSLADFGWMLSYLNSPQ